MKLPPPHRFTYFPGSVIFGRTIVPVYYTDHGPTVPLTDVARAIGLSPRTAFRLVERNQDVINLMDATTCKQIHPRSSLSPLKKRLCLGMDGICVLILNIDHKRIKDPLIRERIIIAKLWLTTQVSNRIKVAGQKHQPRWDAGLNKKQAQELKKTLSRLPQSS